MKALLFDHKFDPNVKDTFGEHTMLSYSIETGKFSSMIQLLRSPLIDPNSPNQNLSTSLGIAFKKAMKGGIETK